MITPTTPRAIAAHRHLASAVDADSASQAVSAAYDAYLRACADYAAAVDAERVANAREYQLRCELFAVS